MRLPMLVSCVSWSFIALGGPLPGHRLPEGAEQRVREREVDIRKLAIELTVDMRRQRIAGAVDISFIPLLDDIAAVHFDAAGPVVSEVELLSGAANTKLEFQSADRRLRVGLPANAASGEELLVRIHYSAEPDTGLYFFPETPTEPAEAWNFGEGGRHYGWLPLYNDTNDRFAVESRITVVKPYVVLGNGKLLDTRENRNGSRTFHWAQDAPIPNYLLALNIGEFVAVPLRSAKVGDREIPLTVWTQEGNEAAAAYSFQSTSDMVEYFSELFGYDYAWDKYDQVTLRNFSGAMETTTMVGFTPLTLTYEDGLLDNSPQLDFAYPSWTNDDTISHELAHHWFGDLVTCRSLASIWLNESFASYSHTVWAGHANGEDDLTYQRWRYLHHYLDFVHETGTVRPLEYYRYDASDDMYTEEITYLKGALVLHMLRHFLGDEAFYPCLEHLPCPAPVRRGRIHRSPARARGRDRTQARLVLRGLDSRRRVSGARGVLAMGARARVGRPVHRAAAGGSAVREPVRVAGRCGGRNGGRSDSSIPCGCANDRSPWPCPSTVSP